MSKVAQKILVVDDEIEIVNILKSLLERDNYKVVETYTGDGAVRKARSETPHLILLDIKLPDITGYEVCNILKKDPLTRYIPIIMLTSMPKADRIIGIGLGADEYITKPCDLRKLKNKIRNVLRRD